MNICILGAGVIGVTTAYRLSEDGHQVTLVDAKPAPGMGASFGNGSQLSYSYVAPLADPSVWTKWPYYLFGNSSPLTLRPRPDLSQWRWLLHFLTACTSQKVKQTTIDLLRLAFFSREQLADVRAEIPLEFFHRTAGKLVMLEDQGLLKSAREQVAFQAAHGCFQQVLDVGRCLEIEPSLAASGRKWVGGVYTESEEVGDCELFCRELITQLSSRSSFRFLPSHQVTSACIKQGRLISVDAGPERVEADAFVLAMGAESTAFARRVGFSLPLYPLKGYSITVPLENVSREAAPQVSITDLSRKIVYARLGDRLRVAGRVELVGMDAGIPVRAINELKQNVADMFPGCVDLSDDAALSPWTGFRPATPTGLPIIGPSPIENLYLNVGHGALGWTLACGSAAILAQQIAGRKTSIDASSFLLNH